MTSYLAVEILNVLARAISERWCDHFPKLEADISYPIAPTPVKYPHKFIRWSTKRMDIVFMFFSIRCEQVRHIFNNQLPQQLKYPRYPLISHISLPQRRRLFQQVLALQFTFGPSEFSVWSYLKEYRMWVKVFQWNDSTLGVLGPTRFSRFLLGGVQWPWSAKAKCFLKKLK